MRRQAVKRAFYQRRREVTRTRLGGRGLLGWIFLISFGIQLFYQLWKSSEKLKKEEGLIPKYAVVPKAFEALPQCPAERYKMKKKESARQPRRPLVKRRHR